MFKFSVGCAIAICVSMVTGAQKITYSQPDREDQKSMSFDIIGKINNHFLVYKSIKNQHTLTILDSSMKTVEKKTLTFCPIKLSTPMCFVTATFFIFFINTKEGILFTV